jgi:acyl-CoA thioesterase-2
MAEPSPVAKTLTLEQIEVNLFRGFNPPGSGPRIFGGQVIAQALAAAYKTVAGRLCHSLQAYFIRPGDASMPVLYEVERSRDGKSFATRRVIAIQKGEQIFNLAASFQIKEQGFEHQRPMPDVPAPDEVLVGAANGGDGAYWAERPIEMRPIDPVSPDNPERRTPTAHIWFRAVGEVDADAPINQAILAYASDLSLLATSMRPHGVTGNSGNVQIASLDHVLWFHRLSHLSDWHLYVQESPNAIGARGLNFGYIYARDGRLVASVAQEGLIRPRPAPTML